MRFEVFFYPSGIRLLVSRAAKFAIQHGLLLQQEMRGLFLLDTTATSSPVTRAPPMVRIRKTCHRCRATGIQIQKTRR